jgi:replicative DNA helicase
VPSISNIAAYASIVREHAVLSKLVSAANEISASAINRDGKSSPEILDKAERLIFEISETRTHGSGPQDIISLLTKTTEQLQILCKQESTITGVPTSFTDLDNMTSGLQKGSLVIVAGRPSMGKTVLLVNFAESCAITTQKPVLFFSLEMPAESIIMRMLSSLGRINQHKLRSGQLTNDDWPRVMSAVGMGKLA